MYIDCRNLLASPIIIREVVHRLSALVPAISTAVCGVPEGATPLASMLAAAIKCPLIAIRKVKKTGHGITGHVMGHIEGTDKLDILLVEDVITTGISTIEAALRLANLGFNIVGVLSIVDRRGSNVPLQGTSSTASIFLPVHSLCSTYGIISYMHSKSLMTWPELRKVLPRKIRPTQYDEDRSVYKLLRIVREKRTALCFSADLPDWDTLLDMVEKVAPYVCAIKVHPDIVAGFQAKAFRTFCDMHQIVCMLDDKVGDIGSVARRQVQNATRHLHPEFMTVHCVPGPDAIHAVKNMRVSPVLVTSMSSAGSFADKAYHDRAMRTVSEHGVHAVVSQYPCRAPNTIVFAPGVRGMECVSKSGLKSDGCGQTWSTVESKYLRGADIIIVGRSIYEAADVKAAASAYAERSFDCFQATDSKITVDNDEDEKKDEKDDDNEILVMDDENADESKACRILEDKKDTTKISSVPVHITDTLSLSTPVYGASCPLGADERQWTRRLVSNSREGAVLTKTITYHPRLPAPSPSIACTPSMIINAVCLENIGADRVTSFLMREQARRLKMGDRTTKTTKWKRPFIVSVHIEFNEVEAWASTLALWAATKCCDGIEWNMCCPNEAETASKFQFTRINPTLKRLTSVSGLPIGLKLPSTYRTVPILNMLNSLTVTPAFITCANAIGGCRVNDARGRSTLGSDVGSISGTEVNRARATAMLHSLAPYSIKYGVPLIACGGVSTVGHARAFLAMDGVVAIQVGASFVRYGLSIFDKLVDRTSRL